MRSLKSLNGLVGSKSDFDMQGKLRALKFLSLGMNFIETIPEQIKDCVSLEDIVLDDNNLDNVEPVRT